ncbi:rRNA biogenesis protein RRP5 [Tanacetum coccineum]
MHMTHDPCELAIITGYAWVAPGLVGHHLGTSQCDGRQLLLNLASDDNVEENPFSNFKIRQTLTAKIVSKAKAENINNIRISRVLPGVGGLIVQLDPHLSGKVHYTELVDSWISNPLYGYHEGQFVKCKVLGVSRSGTGTIHVDLSLHSSLVEMDGNSQSNRYEKLEDLHPDMAVEGYVKNVTPKGCFIMLSRKLDAKILFINLLDEFVLKPRKSSLLGNSVLSLEPLSERIEVSLRKTSGMKESNSDVSNFGSLSAGENISGRVKRIESFVLFITIDQSKMVVENYICKSKLGRRVKRTNRIQLPRVTRNSVTTTFHIRFIIPGTLN